MKCVYSYPWVITMHILYSVPFEILMKQEKIMGDNIHYVESL